MYFRCIPFSGTFDTFGLIYESEENILAGTIIYVPLKSKIELAVCMGEVQDNEISFDTKNIKKVHENFSDVVFLSQEQRQLIDFVAKQYITPIHNALGLYFPKNLIEKISKKKIEKIKISKYNYKDPDIELSENQNKVYKSIKGGTNLQHLIYGVTGSGKTQIYMKLIQDTLREGKQCLLLIPEIILTSQIGERFKKMFGDDVLLLNSSVSAAKKSKYWMDIYSGNAKIVVGTRSSLFYPYNNLGLIIIDEEHDSSYISDSAPRYHSLDVAEKLSRLYNISLVLGSGTPRTTTLYRGINGEYQVSQLLEKYK